MTENVSRRTEIRQRFLAVEAANVCDVLDEMGVPDQGLSSTIQSATGGVVAGWAYTIAGEMAAYVGSGDPLKMEACQGLQPDDISVWSGQGRGVCYFGELIALGMKERGAVGALVDGGIRDVTALREAGFPVHAAYTSAVQSIGRWQVTEYQKPAPLPGATTNRVLVTPGDFILGDEDGAVVIPANVVEEVLIKAEEMTATEKQVRESVTGGMSLSEALEEYGHV